MFDLEKALTNAEKQSKFQSESSTNCSAEDDTFQAKSVTDKHIFPDLRKRRKIKISAFLQALHSGYKVTNKNFQHVLKIN